MSRRGGSDIFPQVKDLYPSTFQTSVVVKQLTQRWEGRSGLRIFRGHDGRDQVTQPGGPHRAYFGQKDYQQYIVIKQLVEDLSLPVTIIRCPTVREADGLAMSSRNRYLGATERELATVLYRALSAGKSHNGWGAVREEDSTEHDASLQETSRAVH